VCRFPLPPSLPPSLFTPLSSIPPPLPSDDDGIIQNTPKPNQNQHQPKSSIPSILPSLFVRSRTYHELATRKAQKERESAKKKKGKEAAAEKKVSKTHVLRKCQGTAVNKVRDEEPPRSTSRSHVFLSLDSLHARGLIIFVCVFALLYNENKVKKSKTKKRTLSKLSVKDGSRQDVAAALKHRGRG